MGQFWVARTARESIAAALIFIIGVSVTSPALAQQVGQASNVRIVAMQTPPGNRAFEVMLGGDPADIVCSGGSHVCFDRTLDEQRVLGLGSVGQSPEGNVAHFVILSPRLEGTLIERGYIEF